MQSWLQKCYFSCSLHCSPPKFQMLAEYARIDVCSIQRHHWKGQQTAFPMHASRFGLQYIWVLFWDPPKLLRLQHFCEDLLGENVQSSFVILLLFSCKIANFNRCTRKIEESLTATKDTNRKSTKRALQCMHSGRDRSIPDGFSKPRLTHSSFYTHRGEKCALFKKHLLLYVYRLWKKN